jgi:hypothetical protein
MKKENGWRKRDVGLGVSSIFVGVGRLLLSITEELNVLQTDKQTKHCTSCLFSCVCQIDNSYIHCCTCPCYSYINSSSSSTRANPNRVDPPFAHQPCPKFLVGSPPPPPSSPRSRSLHFRRRRRASPLSSRDRLYPRDAAGPSGPGVGRFLLSPVRKSSATDDCSFLSSGVFPSLHSNQIQILIHVRFGFACCVAE